MQIMGARMRFRILAALLHCSRGPVCRPPSQVSNRGPAAESTGMESADLKFERRTGILDEDYTILAQVGLVEGLDRPALRDLLTDAWVQTFPRNTVLFLQDDPATRFYIVLEGWVKLYRETVDGHESVIAVYTRGESLGEAAVFDHGGFPVCATAVEESRLLVVPAASFLRHVEKNCAYAMNILSAMSRHTRRLVRQIEQLAVESSTERVAGFLCKLASADDGPTIIQLPLDKALIAGRLGMQPETFSRSLAKLRQFGVESNGGMIQVPDIAALRQFGARDG